MSVCWPWEELVMCGVPECILPLPDDAGIENAPTPHPLQLLQVTECNLVTYGHTFFCLKSVIMEVHFWENNILPYRS